MNTDMIIGATEDSMRTEWQALATPLTSVPSIAYHSSRAAEKLLAVYESIESKLPNNNSRIISFIGTTPTDGTSALTRAYANLLCNELEKRILLLRARDTSTHLNVPACKACEDVVRGKGSLVDVVRQVADSQLYLGYVSTNGRSIATLATRPAFLDVTRELRYSFDYVVLDASACLSPAEAVSLCVRSDGTVVVVESERTRWQVAKHLCDDIESRGGNLLGVVLNKVQRHIPDNLYRWL